MRITVMGIVMVIGGVLLLALVLEYIHQKVNEKPKQSKPKVDGNEQPNLS